jgi:hypothetical protein
MEAVRTSETSVYFNETTRGYIPEGFDLPAIFIGGCRECLEFNSVLEGEMCFFHWNV